MRFLKIMLGIPYWAVMTIRQRTDGFGVISGCLLTGAVLAIIPATGFWFEGNSGFHVGVAIWSVLMIIWGIVGMTTDLMMLNNRD